MADRIGDTTLVKFVGFSAEGAVYSLFGWPRPSAPSRIQSNIRAPLKSPEWKPFKIIKSCSRPSTISQLPKIHEDFRGSLKYCEQFGWHYRYSQVFEVPGKPPLPLSMLTKSTCNSLKPPVTPSSIDSYNTNRPDNSSAPELVP